MSNLDANGFELPWILFSQKVYKGFAISNQHENREPDYILYKIIQNPLWKHSELNSDAFALMSCFRDAVINMNSKASQAIMLHIRDAHKWEKE
jgi:hypothetical protein